MLERKKTCTNKADQLADLVHNIAPQSAVQVRSRGRKPQHWSNECPGMGKTTTP